MFNSYCKHNKSFTHCPIFLFQSDTNASLDKAEILIDIHWSDMTTQATLRSRTEKAAQRLQGVRTSEKQIKTYVCV